MNKIVKDFLDTVESNNKGESEFLQAVEEVAEAILPILNQHSRFDNKKILERMVEPERVISFYLSGLSFNINNVITRNTNQWLY